MINMVCSATEKEEEEVWGLRYVFYFLKIKSKKDGYLNSFLLLEKEWKGHTYLIGKYFLL